MPHVPAPVTRVSTAPLIVMLDSLFVSVEPEPGPAPFDETALWLDRTRLGAPALGDMPPPAATDRGDRP